MRTVACFVGVAYVCVHIFMNVSANYEGMKVAGFRTEACGIDTVRIGKTQRGGGLRFDSRFFGLACSYMPLFFTVLGQQPSGIVLAVFV